MSFDCVEFRQGESKEGGDEDMIGLKVRRVNPDAPLPRHAREGDAGMDLCSMQSVEIGPHETVLVGSGIAMAIPSGYEGTVRPRSGMATKRGVTIANAPGTIDSGYRGEIMLPLHNMTSRPVTVDKGERVCQILIKAQPFVEVVEVDDLGDDTERGESGFGSTGTETREPGIEV